MSRSNETIWPGAIFLLTWWALSTTRLESYAFVLAIVLWLVGRAAIRLAGQSVFRLGARAWWLLGQVAAMYAAFLYLAPAEPHHVILVIWGIALPLSIGAGAARLLYERFPPAGEMMQRGAPGALGIALAVAPFLSWATGFGVLESRSGNLMVAALAAASLYYGWRLAEGPMRGAQDAHFGDAGAYRREGMSDER